MTLPHGRGGGKKRKKKTFTTPKKIKHKKKLVKLSVLKYYKVLSLSDSLLPFFTGVTRELTL